MGLKLRDTASSEEFTICRCSLKEMPRFYGIETLFYQSKTQDHSLSIKRNAQILWD